MVSSSLNELLNLGLIYKTYKFIKKHLFIFQTYY